MPVEIVDRVKKRIIEDKKQSIKNTTQGLDLTDEQINSLVAVSYQYGNIGNFVSTYKTYGNSSELQNNFQVYNNSGVLSTKPFLQGVESNGRAEANWDLFSNGDYFINSGSTKIKLDPMDYTNSTNTINAFYNINLYNADGSVNKSAIADLNKEESSFVYKGDGYKNNLGYLQCTWWANGRASQYLKEHGTTYDKYPTTSGNGGEYWQNNINGHYFKYGSIPKANSLLCYGATSNMGVYGHVTYVEAVDPINKKIYISHASSGKRWNGIDELNWDGTLWGDKPQGYIYLDEPY